MILQPQTETRVNLLLVQLDTLDFPVSFRKATPVVPHPIFTRRSAGGCSATRTLTSDARSAPNTSRAGPITAKRSIKDNLVIVHELGRVAGGCRPVSGGRAPVLRLGAVGVDVIWDGAAGKEEYRDAGIVPGHCVNASPVLVEWCAEAGRVLVEETTASIACFGDSAV